MIEQLSDEQHQRSQYVGLAERDVTTDQFIASVVLTHPAEHLANCRQAIENDAATP